MISIFMHSYINSSKTFFFSFLFVTPVLFIYEFLFFFKYRTENYLRNPFDSLIFNNILVFDKYSQLIFLLIFSVFAIYTILNEFRSINDVKIFYFFLMFLESFAWGTILYYLMFNFEMLILSVNINNSILDNIYLSIGAGIWEELVFRLVGINILVKLLFLYEYSLTYSYIVSIILTSIIFSFAHYSGSFGELFSFATFLYRFIAGVMLGIIYSIRGYGITVYTHIFYNTAIVTQI
tara:strand:- start:112 stop:819 length:708 start_codon:yes stop_codon:yes gene_type:complete